MIQGFMELNCEDELLKVEEAINHLELNRRAQASEADIKAGSVEDYQTEVQCRLEAMDERKEAFGLVNPSSAKFSGFSTYCVPQKFGISIFTD